MDTWNTDLQFIPSSATPFVTTPSSNGTFSSLVLSSSSTTSSSTVTPEWIRTHLVTYPGFQLNGLRLHYIVTPQDSALALHRLAEPKFLPSTSYVTLHFNYDSSHSHLTSFNACIQPSSLSLSEREETLGYDVFHWDFEHCSDEKALEQCKHHCQALFHLPEVLHIVFDVKGCPSLFEGIGLGFFDQLVCAQTLFHEWCQLSEHVAALSPKVPEPLKKKVTLQQWMVPNQILLHVHDQSKSILTFANLVIACGLETISKSKIDASIEFTPLESTVHSIFHSYLLHRCYKHMTHAIGVLQRKYLEYITYDDFYVPVSPSIHGTPSMDQPPFALLVFLYHLLKEKGPMTLPDLSSAVQNWGPTLAKQQISQVSGIKGLMETYPQYLMYEKKSMRELYLDRARCIQWNPETPPPSPLTTTTTTTLHSTSSSSSLANHSNEVDPFLPFGLPKPSELAMFVTLQKLGEMA
ncbi:hypothetical protein HMI54_014140 [Coelomomyces lativittatus]|nr:hypothetical protein HMI56_007317 [Coelomomyces lativittatus]KAJ1514469.1 hypothetical protein HMI54_014140 [Coelomomyces lativittatus]KAJ1515173.1 hypothetical protein HMI55_003973 [Coelomomyces lativittatus]